MSSVALGKDSPPSAAAWYGLGHRLHDQGRIELLQHVAILSEQQPEELPDVVRDEVDLQSVVDTAALDSLTTRIEPHQLADRQQVYAPQVIIRVRRGEPVQVRPA